MSDKASNFSSTNTQKLRDGYWHDKSSHSAQEAMTLQVGQFQDDTAHEFQLYGDRLAERIIDLYEIHSPTPIDESVVLEIGCGMGRYALPFSRRSKFYYGEDMSPRMKEECDNYLHRHAISNAQIENNDGLTLNTDVPLDFVFSTGVFQHIPHFEIIGGYIEHGLALLRDGGILLIQFQGHLVKEVGVGTSGAKITASKLNARLKKPHLNYSIQEINIDPDDPTNQIFLVLQKIPKDTPISEAEKDFETTPMIDRAFRTGVFDDLKSYNELREAWALKKRGGGARLTFYD